MIHAPAVPGKNTKSAAAGNNSLQQAKRASAPETGITVSVRKPLLVSEVVFDRMVNKSADLSVTAIGSGMTVHGSFLRFLPGISQNLGEASAGIPASGPGVGIILMVTFYFTNAGNSRY